MDKPAEWQAPSVGPTSDRTVEAVSFPPGFEELAAVADWCLATPDLRQAKRRIASPEDLAAFYYAVLPRMEEIVALLSRFELEYLPPQCRSLFNIALALAEVAPNVELYGGNPAVPHAFAEERMIAAHGEQETWRGLSPT